MTGRGAVVVLSASASGSAASSRIDIAMLLCVRLERLLVFGLRLSNVMCVLRDEDVDALEAWVHTKQKKTSSDDYKIASNHIPENAGACRSTQKKRK